MQLTIIIALVCLGLAHASLRESKTETDNALEIQGSDMDFGLPEWLRPSKVGPISIKAYMGRWYNTHSSMIPLATYLKGGECIIADYTLEEKSKLDKTLVEFDVVNSQNMDSPTGELQQATGTAKNKCIRAQTPVDGLWFLELTPDDSERDMKGFYVIQQVGPKGMNGEYQWSIVSDLTRTSLFVLSRTPILSDNFTTDVVAWTNSNGFDKSWNSPIATPHSPACVYPGEPMQ